MDPSREREAGALKTPVGEVRAVASPVVLIVGGGVSGCACAATLATQGVAVTVVSGALDTIGQPAYGPDVVGAGGGWPEIMEAMSVLPPVLRQVWLDSAVAPADGAACFAVDRRMVSVETKRALERVEGLTFRQGLVVDLRTTPAGDVHDGVEGPPWAGASGHRLAVETAFGELMEADVVILAVGLSLGGHVVVGADVLPGGRYGETPAEGLTDAVEKLGAVWSEASVEVGPRFSHRGCAAGKAVVGNAQGENNGATWKSGSVPLRQALAMEWEPGRIPWPGEFPPAPHWTEGLGAADFTLRRDDDGVVRGLMSPDGLATGEIHATAGCGEDGTPTRLGQAITGRAVANLNPGGRLRLRVEGSPMIWVTGRAGGATNYLESLKSGVRVADDMISAVRRMVSGGRCTSERAET